MKKLKFPTDKRRLFLKGRKLCLEFCKLNGIKPPKIHVIDQDHEKWRIPGRQWYVNKHLSIKILSCDALGYGGSYPGYTIDRTPYGIICHGLGRHLDWVYSNPRKSLTESIIHQGEYEDSINSQAHFAEMFRLFLTNPNLLEQLRPATFGSLKSMFIPVVDHTWEQVLWNAPLRTWNQSVKKVEDAWSLL